MPENTLADFADEVIAAIPDAEDKLMWGRAMDELIAATDDDDPVRDEARGKYLMALAQVVSNRLAGIARREAKRRAKDAAERESMGEEGFHVDANGRPFGRKAEMVMSPMISVKNESGGSQLTLWTKASPARFVEAVIREQSVVDGRSDANAIRMAVVRIINTDESLMALPTVQDVLDVLGIDHEVLALGDLAM